jgi:putative ABC transport system permease protein
MMISLAILVALAGLATTFTGGLMGYLERSMRADYLLLPEALVLGQANVGAGPELAQRLRTTPGITGVTTIRRGEVQLENGTVQLIGIDPATYPQLAGLVFTGGKPEQAYNQIGQGRAMIINGLLAAQARLTIGQTVGVPTANGQQMFTIVGIGADYLNSRVPTAYVSHENLAQALGVTNDVLLMANRATDAPADEVESALLDLVREYPAFSLLEYADWRQSQLEANQTRTNIMYVLMAILALPSLLALANTLGINVLERTREIGMLRAIGGTRRQIRRMIMTESVLLAVMGTLFGILAGVWLGYALVGAINVAGFVFAYVFPTLGIVVAVVVGLLFGVLAAVLPAHHAARLNIVSALRYE